MRFLKDTIENMHDTFQAFHESQVVSRASRLSPSLAEKLQETSDRMKNLAKDDADEDVDDDEGTMRSSKPIEEARFKTQRKTERTQPNEAVALGYRAISDEDIDETDRENMQNAFVTENDTDLWPFTDWTPPESAQPYHPSATNITSGGSSNALQQRSFPAQDEYAALHGGNNDVVHDPLQIQDSNMTQDPLSTMDTATRRTHPFESIVPAGGGIFDTTSLPNPDSYADQEASFARRLLRSSLETAYRLMTNPNTRPKDIVRMCKFSRCFTNAGRIQEHLKSLMERSASQNLEYWRAPAWHVGSAGLHYPRVGIDAAGAPPAWWANERPIGPLHLDQPDNPMPDCSTTEEVAEKIGYDGEWFDPNDVEQYLRSKGIRLDGPSSIVELDEEETMPTWTDPRNPPKHSPAASTPDDSPRDPRSPENMDINWSDEPFLQGVDSSGAGDTLFMPEPPETSMDMHLHNSYESSAKKFPTGLDFNIFSNAMPAFRTKIKKFVDMDKFVKST